MSIFVFLFLSLFLRPGPVSIAFSHGNTSAVGERLELLKMRRECFLPFFPGTNITMKLVKSFRDCSSLNSQPFRLLHSHRPPTPETHFDVVGNRNDEMFSTGWREFRKPFSWLAIQDNEGQGTLTGTRDLFFSTTFPNDAKKKHIEDVREREREYYRKKNEEKSDESRHHASVLSLSAENLLVACCISSFLNSFRITKQLKRASPLIFYRYYYSSRKNILYLLGMLLYGLECCIYFVFLHCHHRRPKAEC